MKNISKTAKCLPTWSLRTLPSFGNFSWDMHRVSPKSKYQSWYLKPCCGLEVQNSTHALKSVKYPVNTFDLNPKWERTLLPGSYTDLSAWLGLCNSSPQQGVKYRLWYFFLFGGTLYICQRTPKFFPTSGLSQRYYLCYRVPLKNIQISKLIFDTLLWTSGGESHPGT
jgi:hypothetical protein